MTTERRDLLSECRALHHDLFTMVSIAHHAIHAAPSMNECQSCCEVMLAFLNRRPSPAERDRERLDWLEAFAKRTDITPYVTMTERAVVLLNVKAGGLQLIGKGDDYRAAIDAASRVSGASDA